MSSKFWGGSPSSSCCCFIMFIIRLEMGSVPSPPPAPNIWFNIWSTSCGGASGRGDASLSSNWSMSEVSGSSSWDLGVSSTDVTSDALTDEPWFKMALRRSVALPLAILAWRRSCKSRLLSCGVDIMRNFMNFEDQQRRQMVANSLDNLDYLMIIAHQQKKSVQQVRYELMTKMLGFS